MHREIKLLLLAEIKWVVVAHICVCTYCFNDVQHVVGFSCLKRDDGVQWRHQTIAEKGRRCQTWVEIKTDILPLIISDLLFCRVGVKLIGYLGSWHSLMGAGSWLLRGRKLKNSRMLSKASTSFSKAWWATPEDKTRRSQRQDDDYSWTFMWQEQHPQLKTKQENQERLRAN